MTPFALIILLMSVHSRLDAFILERVHINGAMQAGIYASAFRLLEAGNMVGYLAASFLVPFIARNKNDKALIGAVVLNSRHALILLSIGVVSFGLFYAEWIQQLLYHSSDPYISLIIQLTIAVLPASYLVHIYSSVLTATSNFGLLIAILVATVLINLVLNINLIPAYGARGSCIAALVSQYFCGLSCFIAATKKMALPLHMRSLLAYLLAAIALALLFYIGKMTISNVWVILAIAVLLVVSILATQSGNFKKYFVSHH